MNISPQFFLCQWAHIPWNSIVSIGRKYMADPYIQVNWIQRKKTKEILSHEEIWSYGSIDTLSRSCQYYESKVLYNTEATWLSTFSKKQSFIWRSMKPWNKPLCTHNASFDTFKAKTLLDRSAINVWISLRIVFWSNSKQNIYFKGTLTTDFGVNNQPISTPKVSKQGLLILLWLGLTGNVIRASIH